MKWFFKGIKRLPKADERSILSSEKQNKPEPDVSADGSKYCIVCGKTVEGFTPYGTDHPALKMHHIIGCGDRDNCFCPVCGSKDRERWQYYVAMTKTDIGKITGRILHFAPEKPLWQLIRRNPLIDYYPGDIIRKKSVHLTDITDIQYKDEVFDYVISNHVLEHVADEAKAASEVRRVLKKDGKWILSFPICPGSTTIDDERITDPEVRKLMFGHPHHVRLYGIDFKERFEKYGFRVTVFSPKDELDRAEIERYGFIEDDVIMIAEKTDAKADEIV